jgi:hypothetical protein
MIGIVPEMHEADHAGRGRFRRVLLAPGSRQEALDRLQGRAGAANRTLVPVPGMSAERGTRACACFAGKQVRPQRRAAVPAADEASREIGEEQGSVRIGPDSRGSS